VQGDASGLMEIGSQRVCASFPDKFTRSLAVPILLGVNDGEARTSEKETIRIGDLFARSHMNGTGSILENRCDSGTKQFGPQTLAALSVPH